MVCNCFKLLQTTSNSWLCPTIQALLLVPASGKSSFRIMKIHCSKKMWLFWTSPRNSRSPFWCAVALQSTPSAFGLDRVENFEFGLVFSSFFSSISALPDMPLSWHPTRKNGDGVGPNCRDKLPCDLKPMHFGTKISTSECDFILQATSAHICLVSQS